MKGLSRIPNQKQLSKAYKNLQFSPDSVCIRDLALWSQWVRLDPRLGEVLIEHISKFWKKYNPVELNQKLKQQVWSAAFGILLEQVPFYYSLYLKNRKWDQKLFSQWSKCVMTGISPAKGELFFIGIYKAGGKLIKEEFFYSIKPYRQWGYFAKDLLINKAQSTQKTLISTPQRKAILDELIKSYKKITVQDYLEKMNFQIHRRQAQRDLQNHKKLKSQGRTKGKFYIKL